MPKGVDADKDPTSLIRKANCGVPLEQAELLALLRASGISMSQTRIRQLERRALGKLLEALSGEEFPDRFPVGRKRRRGQRV